MVRSADTQMGGNEGQFPSTAWTLLGRGFDPNSPADRERLERLFTSYWKPIYSYFRACGRVGSEDAKDLTQAFLQHLLESDSLARVSPQKGTFRAYLKSALRHFLSNEKRAARAQKRGGGSKGIPIDLPEMEELIRDPSAHPPEEAFDQAWAKNLFETGVRLLEREFQDSGRIATFEAFRLYYLDRPTSGQMTYREVADRLGTKESDVGNYLRTSRNALREILRRLLAEEVSSQDEVEAELALLLGHVTGSVGTK